MAAGVTVDSMAVAGNRIVAVGNRLDRDPDFASYARVDLKKLIVVPGFVDAHTHFGYWSLLLGHVSLDGARSLKECLARIEKHAASLPKKSWIIGIGYSPDRFEKREVGDRFVLDAVTHNRPAFVFNKDMHSAWVNSRAIEISGLTARTKLDGDGEIDCLPDGRPSGILREMAAYSPVLAHVPPPTRAQMTRCHAQGLEIAYRRGVTGVHSFDGPEQFLFFSDLAQRGKLGLRINYYPRQEYIGDLEKTNTRYGTGDEFLRVAGVKIFADGALGSQTAYCYNKYLGSKNNYGMPTATVSDMVRTIKRAAKLGFPCAVHAIGDRAVNNVLEAFEKTKPLPHARHRIEHLQLVRRRDLERVKRLNIVASVQPSHCPSDIPLVRAYWGSRSKNAYAYRSVIDKGIDVALGSDVPVEELDPINGIAAAVRRAKQGSRDVLHPEQRITAYEALYGFTVGSAIACGQPHCRGYLLPGYPADFVVLSQDITRIAPMRIYDTEVVATVLDGTVRYQTRTIF